MSLLPRVSENAREQIARDFDTRGPDVCMTETIKHLEQYNPELLDMATRCAADLGNRRKAMIGFSMFYRLLVAEGASSGMLGAIPRVTEETRTRLVAEIDKNGPDAFTMDAVAKLGEDNPELLQMAHNFASRLGNYLLAMQGFALLYKALLLQSIAQRATLH